MFAPVLEAGTNRLVVAIFTIRRRGERGMPNGDAAKREKQNEVFHRKDREYRKTPRSGRAQNALCGLALRLCRRPCGFALLALARDRGPSWRIARRKTFVDGLVDPRFDIIALAALRGRPPLSRFVFLRLCSLFDLAHLE